MSPATAVRKKVFVAYSYRLYTGDEYRACFSRIGTKYGVDFIFADSRIATEQIFEKIRKMIRESIFSMFDISDWNPNVTLELGFASGIGHPWFILVNPSKSTGGVPEVPADLRGFDRIQYRLIGSARGRVVKTYGSTVWSRGSVVALDRRCDSRSCVCYTRPVHQRAFMGV